MTRSRLAARVMICRDLAVMLPNAAFKCPVFQSIRLLFNVTQVRRESQTYSCLFPTGQ